MAEPNNSSIEDGTDNINTSDTNSQSASVSTLSANGSGTMGPVLRGEVTDLGGLDSTNVWFEYRKSGTTEWQRILNRPAISADGSFWDGPYGASHDDDYAHINEHIREGEAVSFTYYEAGSGADFQPYLRDEKYVADGRIDEIWSGNHKDVLPANEEVTVQVEYVGEEVRIYVNDSLEWTATDIHQESIYFSSYEYAGSSGESSLRLLDERKTTYSPDIFKNEIETGIDLEAGTEYEIRAVADNSSGDPVIFETGDPVEMVGATDLNTTGPTLHGNIELGALDEATVRFEYRESGDSEWSKTGWKSVSGSGEFAFAQPLASNTTYEIRAATEELTGEIVPIETEETVKTLNPTNADTMGPVLQGEVTDLGGLDSTNVWFEYRKSGTIGWQRILNGPAISADGSFWGEPYGASHDDDFVHINEQIREGESVSFTYYEAGSGADFQPHLRDKKHVADGGIDGIWGGDEKDVLSSNEEVVVQVEHVGDEVRIYVGDSLEWTATDIHQESIYFSSYEWSGSSEESSLRLLDERKTVDSPDTFENQIETGVDLEAGTEYDVRAVADGAPDNPITIEIGNPVGTVGATGLNTAGPTLNGDVEIGSLEEATAWFEYRESGDSSWEQTEQKTITESGEYSFVQPLASNTTYEIRAATKELTGEIVPIETGETVKTLNPTNADTLGPTLHGEVADLGGLDSANVWFEYRQSGTTEWQRILNGPAISADGSFWDGPYGASHDNDYVHINEEIREGEAVSFEYYEAGSGADFQPYLRDEKYIADNGINEIWSGDDKDVLSPNEEVVVQVEHVGDKVRIYVGDSLEWTATNIHQESIYFSSYEWSGSSGESSLRLLDEQKIVDSPDTFENQIETGVDLEAGTEYDIRAVTDNAPGEPVTFETGDPVETVGATGLNTTGPTLQGYIELGALDEAAVQFEYRESDDSEWSKTGWKPVSNSGGFAFAQPLASNTTYEIRAATEELTGEIVPIETGETVKTLNPTNANTLGPVLHGEVTDLGGLDSTNVWFEYRKSGTLGWEPLSYHKNISEMSADGDFWSSPSGWAHDGDYVHANDRIEEGESARYVYYEAGSGANFRPHLRSEEYVADGSIDSIWTGDHKNVMSDKETVTLRVEHTGDQVQIYIDDALEWTATGIEEEWVHFSSYEFRGSSGESSLRMLGEFQSVDTPDTFNTKIETGVDLDAGTEYEVRAVADGAPDDPITFETGNPVETVGATRLNTTGPTLNGDIELGSLEEATAWFEYRESGDSSWKQTERKTVTESGEYSFAQPLASNTTYEIRAAANELTGEIVTIETGETVKTLDATNTNTMGPVLHGEVTDLGGLNSANVWFEYRQAGNLDWEPLAYHKNTSEISADGDFWSSPNGWAHDGDYAHLNDRIEEGETARYAYFEAGSGANFRPHLRSEEYVADGSIDSTWSGSHKNIMNDEETVILRVEHDGDQVQIYVDDTLEWTAKGIEEEWVYFSSYEYSGSSGESSLRMLGELQSVDTPGTFNTEIETGVDLDAGTEFEVRAVADGAPDDPITIETGNPVETVGATMLNTSSSALTGNVSLGNLDETTVSFQYRETGNSEWTETSKKAVTESGEFTHTQDLKFDTEYEFRARAGNVISETLEHETVIDDQFFEAEITNTSENVRVGENISVEYRIENIGSSTGSQNISFEVDGTEKDVEKNIGLGENEIYESSFSYQTNTDDTPEVETTVATNNDTVSELISVYEPDEAFFSLSNIDSNEPVEPNDTLDVSVTISNDGELTESQVISLETEENNELVDSRFITLDGGESETITLQWENVIEGAQSKTMIVSSNDDSEIIEISIDNGGSGSQPSPLPLPPGESSPPSEGDSQADTPEFQLERISPESRTVILQAGDKENFRAKINGETSPTPIQSVFVNGDLVNESELDSSNIRYTHTFDDHGEHTVEYQLESEEHSDTTVWDVTAHSYRSMPIYSDQSSSEQLEIAGSTELLTFSFRNPDVNDQVISVEIIAELPDGLSISSTKDVSEGDAAIQARVGTVAPGQTESMRLSVQVHDESLRGEELEIPYEIRHYPEGNPDKSLTKSETSMQVTVGDAQEITDDSAADDGTTDDSTPGFSILVTLPVLYSVIRVMIYRQE
ncbi:hypothetical protein GS429_07345 [Natronorubrum sp. JWXQ-INN-674]|uniref:Uncharacterized protein n=1 Tax=Natronorubrum halalkaliphilum TaxID=2691917 RepID=A0A6B0VM74_9EURY|nr:hypothetical protein [Natronorubrum halalkaliphilum]MXV61872.1 hypothetical protein [Natronorubrum halalkaliphilum]